MRLGFSQIHLAERTGFEPADGLPHHRFSKPALSTTQPPLQLTLATGITPGTGGQATILTNSAPGRKSGPAAQNLAPQTASRTRWAGRQQERTRVRHFGENAESLGASQSLAGQDLRQPRAPRSAAAGCPGPRYGPRRKWRCPAKSSTRPGPIPIALAVGCGSDCLDSSIFAARFLARPGDLPGRGADGRAKAERPTSWWQ